MTSLEFRNPPDSDRLSPESIESLSTKIAKYEEKYGMTSAKLEAGIKDGSIVETFDILTWAMFLNVRETILVRFARTCSTEKLFHFINSSNPLIV